MTRTIILLIVFSSGLVWAAVELLQVRKKQLGEEYKKLYVENKLLWGAIFLVLVIMQIEKL